LPSSMRMNWIELGLRQWPFSKSELYRNIVKPARCEAAIEMPQSRDDNPDHGNAYIGTRLVENQKSQTLSVWLTDPSAQLLRNVETAEFRTELQLDRWLVV